MKKWKASLSLPFFFFLLVMPASTDFKLKDYGFGSGGVANGTSPNYALSAITGEQSGSGETSPSYQIGPGLFFTNQANVPGAPTFTNPSNYYNKLWIVLDTGSNPSDTKFAIAISADNFATTNYVQSDDTVGAILGSEDYQTNATWGAGGFYVIGLSANTTYKVKVKAMQGKFTETGYGPTATAATVNPTLAFGIRTTSQSSPPFSINFGSMIPSSINTSPENILISLDTNSAHGGSVYVYGANAGLNSAGTVHKIDSVTGNLGILGEGFGAQGVSATQTTGGPLNIAAIYNAGGDIVGIIDQNVRNIFDTANPIGGGSASFALKAKPAATAPPANDYSELLTVIAAGSF